MAETESGEYRNWKSGDYLKRLKSEPVYGPINSRRLGLSLGINPIQGGFGCNFDCSYCQYGVDDLEKQSGRVRFTELSEIYDSLKKRLQTREHYDSITICGPTEPLLHPEFDSIVDIAVSLRDHHRPGIPTSMFTNASRMIGRNTWPLDYVFMKLDAGNEETFRRVNRPRGIAFNELVCQIRGASVRRRIIQTMVVGGSDGNLDPSDLTDYKRILQQIAPEEVHLYSLLYRPLPNRELEYVDRHQLSQLAAEIEAETGSKAMIFVDPVEEGQSFRF